MQENILNQTYQFAQKYHLGDNSGHDFEHIKRVYTNIDKLLNEEKCANKFICRMSAFMHLYAKIKYSRYFS